MQCEDDQKSFIFMRGAKDNEYQGSRETLFVSSGPASPQSLTAVLHERTDGQEKFWKHCTL